MVPLELSDAQSHIVRIMFGLIDSKETPVNALMFSLHDSDGPQQPVYIGFTEQGWSINMVLLQNQESYYR